MERLIKSIAAVYAFCVAFPIIPIVIALIIVALLVFGKIGGCNRAREQKKIERTKDGIIANKAEANVLTNQRANAQSEVNQSAVNTNQAFNNFNAVVNRDSNQYSGTDADDRYCRRYPRDSSCAEWRRLRGMQ